MDKSTKVLVENTNRTYQYGPIKADGFTLYLKNLIIANFFNNIGRADKLGSGVRNLYKYTKMYADSEPIIFEDDVFRADISLFKNANSDKIAIKDLDDREMIIYQFIAENGSVYNSQARKLLNLKAVTMENISSKMLDK